MAVRRRQGAGDPRQVRHVRHPLLPGAQRTDRPRGRSGVRSTSGQAPAPAACAAPAQPFGQASRHRPLKVPMDHRRTPTGKAYVPASWFIVLTIMLCVGAAGWLGWLFVDDDPDAHGRCQPPSPRHRRRRRPTPTETTETTPSPTPTTESQPRPSAPPRVSVLNNTTIQGLATTYSAKVPGRRLDGCQGRQLARLDRRQHGLLPSAARAAGQAARRRPRHRPHRAEHRGACGPTA